MTPAQAQALLGVAASFDNRKPSEEAAIAWSVALDGYRFVDCRDAIVEHYVKGNEWLMPSHVIAIVKRIRAKRLADHPEPTPPPHLAELPTAHTAEWLKDARRRIGDGETLDDQAAYGVLKERHLPDLRAITQKPESAA